MHTVSGTLPTTDVAMFIDVDNIWLSCRNDELPFLPSVLHETARVHGRLILARAYGDWSESYLYEARLKLQEEAFDLMQLPGDQRGKNTADIQMAVDALEIALGPRPPTVIVLVSGDRDFVPLVKKLKQHRVQVVAIATASATGRQIKNACDVYIEYDDLVSGRETPTAPVAVSPAKPEPRGTGVTDSRPAGVIQSKQELQQLLSRAMKSEEAIRLVPRAVAQLQRQGAEAVGAAIMQMIRRIDNGFELGKYGYSKFLDLAEAAEREGYVQVNKRDGSDVTLTLTMRGAEAASVSMGTLPRLDTPAAEAKHYDELMRRKKVIVVPEPWRTKLIRELADEIGESSDGMSIREMNEWIRERAAFYGLSQPGEAWRKLVWSLNLAICFKDKYGLACEQRDEDMPCHLAVDCEQAIDRVELRFVTGVMLEAPDVPMTPEGVALWLFGDAANEQYLDRATLLVERAVKRN